MVCTIPASAWTWLVRSRKASAVTMNGAGFDAGEGTPGRSSSSKSGWGLARQSRLPPSVEGGRGCLPYVCHVDCTSTGAPHTSVRPVARVELAMSTGQLSEGMIT
ncbi:hypothetical protein B296_00053570 [Ensete ventricosum]|uniref:Uncharacterized protein n=1 Tax=Ensete ventricosum TaxID=4639 RepID=A0A426X3F0_ENSVE|nr:hypothetical protein B296_00053570 [Ensete ventricosum]